MICFTTQSVLRSQVVSPSVKYSSPSLQLEYSHNNCTGCVLPVHSVDMVFHFLAHSGHRVKFMQFPYTWRGGAKASRFRCMEWRVLVRIYIVIMGIKWGYNNNAIKCCVFLTVSLFLETLFSSLSSYALKKIPKVIIQMFLLTGHLFIL